MNNAGCFPEPDAGFRRAQTFGDRFLNDFETDKIRRCVWLADQPVAAVAGNALEFARPGLQHRE